MDVGSNHSICYENDQSNEHKVMNKLQNCGCCPKFTSSPTILLARVQRFFWDQYLSEVFLGGANVNSPPANAGDSRDMSSIPRPGRSPSVGNGNLLWYSCLGKSHGQRSLVGHSTLGCKESDMIDHTHTYGALRSSGWFSSTVWGSLS